MFIPVAGPMQTGPGFAVRDGALGQAPSVSRQEYGALRRKPAGIWGADGRFYLTRCTGARGQMTCVNHPDDPRTWTVPTARGAGARGLARSRARAAGRAASAASRRARAATAARVGARYARPRVRTVSGLGAYYQTQYDAPITPSETVPISGLGFISFSGEMLTGIVLGGLGTFLYLKYGRK